MSVLWPEPGNLRHGVRFWPKASFRGLLINVDLLIVDGWLV